LGANHCLLSPDVVPYQHLRDGWANTNFAEKIGFVMTIFGSIDDDSF
jgi:hypothetical protein